MYCANKEDIERSKKIISKEFKNNKINISDDEIEKKAIEILNISYSIGGGYDEYTLTEIVRSLLAKQLL